MAIENELRELINIIMEYPDEIEKLNLFVKLKNGTIFKYKVDRIKELQINLRAQKENKKLKKKIIN